MAIDTKLKNIGAAAAQLSNDLSFIEKQQLNNIKNVGSVTATAGKLNSDVSSAISRLTSAQKSAMDLGADLSSKLEGKGVFGKNTTKLVSSAISSSVKDKIPLSQQFPQLPVDLSNYENRLPSSQFKTAAEKIKNTKEDILGRSDLRFGGITYPPDLTAFGTGAAAYVKLQFFKYTRSNAFSAGSIEDKEYVELPLPDNLSTSFNIKYQERDTGIMGDLMNSAAVQSGITAAEQTQGGAITKMAAAMSAMGGSITNLSGGDAMKAAGETLQRAGFAGLESASDVAGGLAGQIVGSIPNPHPTVFFKGMELRQFQWNWKFVPRSQEEAIALEKALAMMKQFILPSKGANGDNTFLQYPYMVQPQIKGTYPNIYGKFKKALVSGFTINFMGEGTSAFYVDGSPVSVMCAMNFQEVENYTSEDV